MRIQKRIFCFQKILYSKIAATLYPDVLDQCRTPINVARYLFKRLKLLVVKSSFGVPGVNRGHK